MDLDAGNCAVRQRVADCQESLSWMRVWYYRIAAVSNLHHCRGWKVVSRFVPSHPSCIEPVVLLMESLHDLVSEFEQSREVVAV